ncbi:hypothetical protein [Williamsia muralis]|nr:hypothetical protein [Williamsia marianensis]
MMSEREVQYVVRGDMAPIKVARSPRGDGVMLRQAYSWIVLPSASVDALLDTIDQVLDAEPVKPAGSLGELSRFPSEQKPGHPTWGRG